MANRNETIRGFGKCVHSSEFGKSEGHSITNDFLCNITTNFYKNSLEHRKHEDYLPFIYGERQIHSILCPAIYDSSDSLLIEAGVNRKKRGDDNVGTDHHGWVDYYCNYRKFIYFLEIKHSFYSPSSKIVKEVIKKKWHHADKQLQSVKKEITDWIKPNSKGAFRVAMLILPYFHSVDKDLSLNSDEILEQHSNINTTLKTNWSSLCLLNKKMSGPYEYDKSTEMHPAVGIYCKISDIHK